MSDILIKGMEIPKRCTGCFHSKCLLFFENTDPDNSRHPNCPLIELPPHGRIGDLDLVEEWMRKKHKEHDCPFNIDAFLFALKKFPTILEASE